MRLRLWLLTPCLALALLAGPSLAATIVRLDDDFSDGDRTDTNLPDESAFFVGRSANVLSVGPGLAYDVGGSSEKLWTYFANNHKPVKIGVGGSLKATIDFTPQVQPGGEVGDTDSRGFRLGLFNDPTNPNLLEDANSDSGGGIWGDATGYGIQIALSDGNELTDPFGAPLPPLSSNIRLGKRVGGSDSLMGSSGAYEFASGGNDIVVDADVQYTLMLLLERIADDQMEVTFSISDAGGVISEFTILDDPNGTGEFGTDPIATHYKQLFFRFSNENQASDVIRFDRILVEHNNVPEPSAIALALLAAIPAFRRVR